MLIKNRGDGREKRSKFKIRKFSQKIATFGLAFLLMLGGISSGLTPVNAAESYTGPFTRVKEIKYPSWWADKIPGVKDWSTWMCTYNGQWSYCLEASKHAPGNGTYAADVINNNPMVKKLLYYGFGGPNQILFLDETDETAYLYTHVLLSYAYSGDMCGADLDALGNLGVGLKGVYQYVQDLPEPTDASFDGNNMANLTATYDSINKEQKTNTVNFTAGSNATANVTLQEGVTLHNVTRGTTGTGTVTIYGGDSFYLTAPTTVIQDYTSGDIAGSNCNSFVALAISPNSNVQTHGSWTWDPGRLRYTVDWLDTGSIELRKVSEHSEFIDGAKFLLKSTSYEGFEQEIVVKDGKIKVDNIPVGEYLLTETEAPDGYAVSTETYEIQINPNETTDKVVVNKLRPSGTLNIHKTLETATEGAVNKGDEDVTNVRFKVTANQEIRDNVSLEKLYNAGDAITVGSGQGSAKAGVSVVKGTEIGNGVYAPDANGDLVIKGLPIGTYNIEEVDTSTGYVKEDGIKSVQFVQEDFTTTVYEKNLSFDNGITKTVITKEDFGGTEVPGAQMTVKDSEGNVIDKWTSSSTSHEIDGLIPGKTYTLYEDLAPAGYVKATEVKFTVNEDNTVKNVNMVDKQVKILKLDADENNVIGASMQILDKNGNIVDSWITDGNPHFASNLVEGEKYTLHEEAASDGYVLAKDVEFTVSKNKETQEVKMIDTMVLVAKTDANGNSIEDATLQVVSSKTKNIFDKWTTKNFVITDEIKSAIEKDGSYKEVIPEEMPLADDETDTPSNVKTTIVYSKYNDAGTYKVVMTTETTTVDSQDNSSTTKNTEVYLADEDGNTSHAVKGLYAGQDYILQEVKAPDGYALAKDISFTTSETENVFITMVDKKVSISKVDATNEKELPGAELTITDKDNVVIDKWTSEETSHVVSGLEVGKTYILHEDLAPLGYATASDIEFTVTDDGIDQLVTMKDEITKVDIVKIDAVTGNNLQGATLQLIDKDGNLVEEWVTTGEAHRFEGLHVGETYTIKEIKAPDGYKLAENITFTVSNTGEVQKIEMKDERVIKTGDTVDTSAAVIGLAASGAIAAACLAKRKKENQ